MSARPALASVAAGARAGIAGLRHALLHRETRRAYWRLVLAHLLVWAALVAAGCWAALALTVPAEGASAWVQAGLLAARVAGLLVTLIAAPVLALVLVNVGLPLLADRLFLESLRALDPAAADALARENGLSVAKQAAVALRRLARYVALFLCGVVLSLVPVVGAALGPAWQIYLALRMLGWELLDPWLGQRGLDYAAQRAYLVRHRAVLLGFALPWLPVLALPLAGPFLLGLAQAATAVLVHDELD